MRIICIPAYNEADTIAGVIKGAAPFGDRVIVCDDGSTDGTGKVSRDAGAEVIEHKKNQGYGSSIASLFKYARLAGADVMVTIDGDGQHDPGQIPLLVSALEDHSVDVVIGSRFLGDGRIPGYRKAGIKIITSVSNMGTNLKISDSQSGLRAYSKNAILAIHPTESGMSVSTEIILKSSNKGLSMAEVPVSVSYGAETSGHNPLSHGVSVLANTIKYTSIRHPLVFYGVPGTVFLTVGIIMSGIFMDAYLHRATILFGPFLAGIILILLGAILIIASIILFSMANLIRDQR